MTETTCGASAVFSPDVEACDAVCILPRGHQPVDVHADWILGEWREAELTTWTPEEDE